MQIWLNVDTNADKIADSDTISDAAAIADTDTIANAIADAVADSDTIVAFDTVTPNDADTNTITDIIASTITGCGTITENYTSIPLEIALADTTTGWDRIADTHSETKYKCIHRYRYHYW